MLTIKAVRSYTSKQGNKVFVYGVSGNKEDLEKFKAVSGEFFREDEEGKPLWFTTRSVGDKGQLVITTNNKIVPDMSAFDQAASLAKQYGGNLGEALAKAAVDQLLGNKTAQADVPANKPADTDLPD